MYGAVHRWWNFGRIVQEILSVKAAVDPKLFVLGIHPKGHKLQHREQIFIDVCLLQAKRSAALTWKAPIDHRLGDG